MNKVELKQIAKTMGWRPYQQEKLYIQTLILKSIYANCDPVFKGGTALLIAHGLNRFSEDLDFTANEDCPLERLMKVIHNDLLLYGISTRVDKLEEEVEGGGFRVGAEGPLFTKELSRCFVRVEISLRETTYYMPEMIALTPIYPNILPFTLSIMDRREILAEKVRAIFMREKARDLYDTWFLVTHDVQTEMALVDQKLGLYDIEFDFDTFITRVKTAQSRWEGELPPILIGSLPNFTDVSSTIIMKIHEFLRI